MPVKRGDQSDASELTLDDQDRAWMQAQALKFVKKNRRVIFNALLDRAMGTSVLKRTHAGVEYASKEPPDTAALRTLLELAVGKPKEVKEKNAGFTLRID